MAELTGKRIVITGAAEGIGLAIAQVCAREGAALILFDINADLVAQQRAALPAATWVVGNLADDADLARLVDTATGLGRVDAVVHNAAVNSYAGTVTAIGEDDWDRVMGVNLRGAWMLTRLLIPHFQAAGGGTVLTITSIHSHQTYPAHFPYNITKGALRTFVQSLAIDYAEDHIRSVGIAPGWVHTANIDRWLATCDDPASAMAQVNASHPTRRIGRPAEIGELASFILSDRCPYLNGTTVTCDGGLTGQLRG